MNKLIIMDVFLGRTETLVNNKYEKLTNTATENLGKQNNAKQLFLPWINFFRIGTYSQSF